jgi:hypothetical protein
MGRYYLLIALVLGVGCSGQRNNSTNRNLGTGEAGTEDAEAGAGDGEEPGEDGEDPAPSDEDAAAAQDSAALEDSAAPMQDADVARADADSSTSGGSQDGAATDASVAADADPGGDASAVGEFSISVRRGVTQVANARLLLHSADGTLLSEQRTDATGVYRGATTPDSISVVEELGVPPFVGPLQVITFLAVRPGDHLTVQLDAQYSGDGESEPIFNVSYAAAPPDSTYAVWLRTDADNCGIGLSNAPFSATLLRYQPRCARPASYTILASAQDINSVPTGFAWLSGATLGAPLPTPVTLGAWSAPASATLTIDGIPPGWGLRVRSNAHAQGRAYDITPSEMDFDPDSARSSRSINVAYPAGLSDGLSASVESTLGSASYAFGVRAPISTPNLSFDLASRLAPPTSSVWDPSNPSRPLYTWSVPASPISADGIFLRISWITPGDGELPDSEFPWIVIAPPDTTQVRIPQLPTNLAGIPTRSPLMGFAISYYADSTQGGYRDFVAAPLSLSDDSSGQGLGRHLSQPGTLQVTSWGDSAGGI